MSSPIKNRPPCFDALRESGSNGYQTSYIRLLARYVR